MFKTKVKISIRSINYNKELADDDIETLFNESLKKHSKTAEVENLFEKCYYNATVYTVVGKKGDTKKQDLLEDASDKKLYFMTKKAITDGDIFKDAIKTLVTVKDEFNEHNVKLRVEVLFNHTYKFPLFIRDGKLLPPETYHDLGYIDDRMRENISRLNKDIFDE